jgi:predicted RNase H-like HicB family nuclease
MQIHALKVDFVKLSREYAGKWVALDPDTNDVIAVGSSAQEVLDKASELGIEEPVITDVVEDYSAYVPCGAL